MRELIIHTQDYQDGLQENIWTLLQHRLEVQPENLYFLLLFVAAVVHTFFAPALLKAAKQHLPKREMDVTVGELSYLRVPCKWKQFSFRLFFWEWVYFLGEIEVVFGLWAVPLTWVLVTSFSWDTMVNYFSERSYHEATYLMVSMAIASTYPVIRFVERVAEKIVGCIQDTPTVWWWVILTVGPLFGSLLKETSMMTILSILLLRHFFCYRPSPRLAFTTLSLLFVNTAVGGTLTNFASATVLLVQGVWDWSSLFMLQTFGWKAVVGISLSNTVHFLFLRKDFEGLDLRAKEERLEPPTRVPFWVTFVHLLFLSWVIFNNEQPTMYLAAFVLFLGFYQATGPYQIPMSLRNPILIAFFVASITVFSVLQGWWVEALLEQLTEQGLMFMAMALSAVCHNTTVAYLATFVPHLGDIEKVYFFQGAIVAGGLTLISNGANIIGYNLLSFGFPETIAPYRIFFYSLLPTLIMAFIFLFL